LHSDDPRSRHPSSSQAFGCTLLFVYSGAVAADGRPGGEEGIIPPRIRRGNLITSGRPILQDATIAAMSRARVWGEERERRRQDWKLDQRARAPTIMSTPSRPLSLGTGVGKSLSLKKRIPPEVKVWSDQNMGWQGCCQLCILVSLPRRRLALHCPCVRLVAPWASWRDPVWGDGTARSGRLDTWRVLLCVVIPSFNFIVGSGLESSRSIESLLISSLLE
jgi:hypothetical protein